jgi:hypothetical protein
MTGSKESIAEERSVLNLRRTAAEAFWCLGLGQASLAFGPGRSLLHQEES